MPLPISLTLLLGAVSFAIAGPHLVAWIMVGLAVANEGLRFLVLRSSVDGSARPAEYTIPARPQPRVQGDDGG